MFSQERVEEEVIARVFLLELLYVAVEVVSIHVIRTSLLLMKALLEQLKSTKKLHLNHLH